MENTLKEIQAAYADYVLYVVKHPETAENNTVVINDCLRMLRTLQIMIKSETKDLKEEQNQGCYPNRQCQYHDY